MKETTGGEVASERCYTYNVFGRFVIGTLVCGPLVLGAVALTILMRGDLVLVINLFQLAIFASVSLVAYFLYPVRICLRPDCIEIYYIFGGKSRFEWRYLIVRRNLGGTARILDTSPTWKARLVGSFKLSSAWLEDGEEVLAALEARSTQST